MKILIKSIFLVAILVSNAFSYYYNDDQNKLDYYNKLDLFQPYDVYSKNDNFSLTPKTDFLKSSLNNSKIQVMQLNDTFNDFVSTKLAYNVNISDYIGKDISMTETCSSYSVYSSGYDTQNYSNIQYSNDTVKSFDITTYRDTKITESIDKIKYNDNNLISCFNVVTRNEAGKLVNEQKISDITYMLNPNQQRYKNKLEFIQSKINEPETVGWDKLEKGLKMFTEPPVYLAKSFTLETNENKLKFKELKWENDLIVGFESSIEFKNESNIETDKTTIKVSSILDDTSKVKNIIVKAIKGEDITHKEWNRDSGIKLEDFINEMDLKDNPLKILGSSNFQIGESKVAYLTTTKQETNNIDYGITDKLTKKNAVKKELFRLEQTAPAITKTVISNKNIRNAGKNELIRYEQTIRQEIGNRLNTLSEAKIKAIETNWGQSFEIKQGAKFSLNTGNKIVCNKPLEAKDGTKLKNAEFIIKGNKLQAVSGLIIKSNGITEVKQHSFKKPVIEQHKNIIQALTSGIKQAVSWIGQGIKKTYYAMTSWHFEGRDKRNTNLPKNYTIMTEIIKQNKDGWREVDLWQALNHQDGDGKAELKFVNKDGREVVYDGDILQMEKGRYKGTFNYCTVSEPPKKAYDILGILAFVATGMGHYVIDVAPYAIGGSFRGRDPLE